MNWAATLFCVITLQICVQTAPTHLHSKFIATVHDEFDLAYITDLINTKGREADAIWSGSVVQSHEAIRVIIISGQKHTCDVITAINGVKQCEPDSTVTAAN